MRLLRWWQLLAARALPHLPLPQIGFGFQNDEALLAKGRRALAWWLGITLALLVLRFRIFAIVYFAFGFSKMRTAAKLARAAGFGPDHQR